MASEPTIPATNTSAWIFISVPPLRRAVTATTGPSAAGYEDGTIPGIGREGCQLGQQEGVAIDIEIALVSRRIRSQTTAAAAPASTQQQTACRRLADARHHRYTEREHIGVEPVLSCLFGQHPTHMKLLGGVVRPIPASPHPRSFTFTGEVLV